MLRSTTILLIISVLIMMSPAVMAQDDEIPTVAILRSGLSSSIQLADRAMLDMLHAYGFISDAERLVLEEEQDLYGEKLNIIWRNAGYDLPTTNIMVEEALDRGVDVMITVSTTVTQIAVNATRDMEDPPVIIFNIVSAPYSSGIADASCIKPDYVTGTSPSRSYESYLALVVLQDPDISDVGALVNPSEPSSVESAKRITEVAESLGLTVHTASVATITDVNIATESLLGKGVEALVLGISATVNNSLSTVVKLSTDYGVPVYSVVPRHVFLGVTIALGFDDHYGQGVTAARMFIAYLNGDLDTSTIGIHESFGDTVALNLDSAAAQGIEISEDILARAKYWVEDGVTVGAEPPKLAEMTLEERKAEDAAFLESLRCTPEMIADQLAELDAAD